MCTSRRFGRSVWTIAAAISLALGSLAAGGGPAAGQVDPEDVLSHLLCYRGSFAPFDPVPDIGFDDQFSAGPIKATVRPPNLFCNPVRKERRSGEVTRITDPTQHLKGYPIRTQTNIGTFDVLDSNQFGADQALILDRTAVRVMVPTRKAPHDPPTTLDHFLCYPVVQGAAVGKRVELRDQFGSFRTRVGRPRLHCNPTDKSHPPGPPTTIQHEFAHLLCYRIERHRLDPPRARRTRNQFEKRKRVRAEVAVMLCVPSEKSVV